VANGQIVLTHHLSNIVGNNGYIGIASCERLDCSHRPPLSDDHELDAIRQGALKDGGAYKPIEKLKPWEGVVAKMINVVGRAIQLRETAPLSEYHVSVLVNAYIGVEPAREAVPT